MIEIVWCETSTVNDYMLKATNLLAWLLTTINHQEEYRNIDFNGYMMVKDKTNGCATLLICGDPSSQKKLLTILQQPPEEYKEKYIARVPCDEPMPVHEQTEEEANENKIKPLEET